MSAIEYSIRPTDPLGHYFEIDLIIWQPLAQQMVQMPTWIPGSYMIRNFSRQIKAIFAYEINQKQQLISPVTLEAKDSHTWEIHTTQKPLLIRATIYAFDASVRTAYLDQQRGFYNHSSLCLQALGFTDQPCLVHIEKQTWMGAWSAVTTMTPQAITKNGFGTYGVSNYAELIDHPVSLGHFQSVRWKARGIRHHMAIQGATQAVDTAQLKKDLQAITNSQIAFFEPTSHAAPFREYLFHVNVSSKGYGGLEHRSATALLCQRKDLPYKNLPLNAAAYEDFLGLCSHEYFHAWHVKNIQPEVFQPYVLDAPTHTRLLWLFEGFTSYYDDLILLRSKVITLDTYITRLNKTINQVLATPGRLHQSVAQSSFDAWTKYYVTDENSLNTVVSYYTKGALIALALDLTIRQFTQQRQSLDDVMRHLWQTHGGEAGSARGLPENGFKEIVCHVVGESFQSTWKQFERRYIFGTEDLPLAELFAANSWTLKEQVLPLQEVLQRRLGIRTTSQDGWVKVTHVLEHGSALKAGIAVGNLLVSINCERLTPHNLYELLERFAGQTLRLMVFCDDILQECVIAKDERLFSKWQVEWSVNS